MRNKFFSGLLILTLLATMLLAAGCDEAEGPAPCPGDTELNQTLVPDMPLDVYVYLEQEDETHLPADTVDGLPFDIDVASLAIWGAASGEDFGFAAALTLGNAQQAGAAYAEITEEEGVWTKLSGNTIYFVHGSGPAAGALTAAIDGGSFKPYDDNEGLAAASSLAPASGSEKMVAIAILKPTPALIAHMSEGADESELEMVNSVLSVTQLKVVAGAVYATDQIDVTRMAAIMDEGGDVLDTGVSVMGMVRSGLPGLLVSPAVGKILTEQGFVEVETGGETLYKMTEDTGTGKTLYVFVRVDGGKVFMAAAAEESRAINLVLGAS